MKKINKLVTKSCMCDQLRKLVTKEQPMGRMTAIYSTAIRGAIVGISIQIFLVSQSIFSFFQLLSRLSRSLKVKVRIVSMFTATYLNNTSGEIKKDIWRELYRPLEYWGLLPPDQHSACQVCLTGPHQPSAYLCQVCHWPHFTRTGEALWWVKRIRKWAGETMNGSKTDGMKEWLNNEWIPRGRSD